MWCLWARRPFRRLRIAGLCRGAVRDVEDGVDKGRSCIWGFVGCIFTAVLSLKAIVGLIDTCNRMLINFNRIRLIVYKRGSMTVFEGACVRFVIVCWF